MISLANAIIVILGHEKMQKTLIEDDQFLIILDLFVFSYTRDTAKTEYSLRSKPEQELHRPPLDPEDEAQLTALRSALSARLWDLTALAEFTVKDLLESKFVQRLISWLSIKETQMQVCACSILRNIASSNDNATDLVMVFNVHKLLISFLDESNDLQVLEESIRLMKNLAVPIANKEELERFESITLLWSKFESPTLHYTAASLVRQLLRGFFGNVHRFLTPNISAGSDSCVTRSIRLYSSTSDPAVKTEIARTFVEIWRTANSGYNEEVRSRVDGVERAVRQLNVRPDEMIKPVVTMIVKSENPSLVTEGWFGLALMAGSEEWVEAIFDALCQDATKDAFRAAILSRDAHSKDRDNCRILSDRLMKHSVSLILTYNQSPDQTR